MYTYKVELYLLKVSHVTHTTRLCVSTKGSTIQPKTKTKRNKTKKEFFITSSLKMRGKRIPLRAHISTIYKQRGVLLIGSTVLNRVAKTSMSRKACSITGREGGHLVFGNPAPPLPGNPSSHSASGNLAA